MHQDPMGGANRRDLLESLGAAALLSGSLLLGQPSPGPTRVRRRRIDVHHHMMPSLIDLWANRHWSPEVSLETMDKFETETAILSITGLQPQFADPFYDGSERARKLVRDTNEFGAKVAHDNPARFGFFAALPLPDRDASLKEIEYSFDALKADGVMLFSNTGDKWLGDPLFRPIMEELNHRKAAVFIHPSVAKCCRGLVPGVRDTTLEFDLDTTRTVGSLLYNGVLAQMPDIHFIVNHSGAAVPALAGRMRDQVRGEQGRVIPGGPAGAWDELRKLYFECAHATFQAPFAAVTKFAPTTQLLFGTDYPVWPYETTTSLIPELNLPPDLEHALDRGNAERLFPRLKS
jgi:predicted TIM-barrel fold metal-dependent hydrolase